MSTAVAIASVLLKSINGINTPFPGIRLAYRLILSLLLCFLICTLAVVIFGLQELLLDSFKMDINYTQHLFLFCQPPSTHVITLRLRYIFTYMVPYICITRIPM